MKKKEQIGPRKTVAYSCEGCKHLITREACGPDGRYTAFACVKQADMKIRLFNYETPAWCPYMRARKP